MLIPFVLLLLVIKYKWNLQSYLEPLTHFELTGLPILGIPVHVANIFLHKGRIMPFVTAKGWDAMLPSFRKLISSNSAVGDTWRRLKSRNSSLPASHNNSIMSRHERFCYPSCPNVNVMIILTLTCTHLRVAKPMLYFDMKNTSSFKRYKFSS